MTFSSPNFLPWIASATKSRSPLGNLPCASRMRARARARRTAEALPPSCAKLALDGPGSVFLNSSRASSSDKILMVSWMATSSSARSFLRSSHSEDLLSQSFLMLAANSRSSAREPCVASNSCFMLTISTWSVPMRSVFFSMAAVRMLICFVFAAWSSSKTATDFASASCTSFRLAAKSSFICFRIPVTSPLFGTYSPEPCKNPITTPRSNSVAELSATALRSRAMPASLCSSAPPLAPRSMAAMAFVRPSTYILSSDSFSRKPLFCFSRSATALASVSLAAALSSCACLRSSLVCASWSPPSWMLVSSCGTLDWPSAMAAARSFPVPVQ
mmetsp:Transcript_87175/g.230824  ORF Transcript_87175/g.230824 Transcript_87175/m.230824 type:complete len:330 (-) Transcript_87175:280-1269(-)